MWCPSPCRCSPRDSRDALPQSLLQPRDQFRFLEHRVWSRAYGKTLDNVSLSPVYFPIFFCIFAVALFFATIFLMTTETRKPGDQTLPVGYKRQDDERQKCDQTSYRVMGQHPYHPNRSNVLTCCAIVYD
jgi:hypothetical protein